MPEENFAYDLSNVSLTLKKAKEQGLEVEVITSALRILKSNPEMSIKDALVCGLKEWDVKY